MNKRYRKYVLFLMCLMLPVAAMGAEELAAPALGDQSLWIVAIGLAFGTLISEDVSALTGAGIVALGHASPWLIGAAIFLGIWLGDIGLWLVGRFGRKTSARLPGLRRIAPSRLVQARRFLRRWGWGAIFLSRIIPGSRLPLYVAAGAVRWSLFHFALSTALAVGIWTALLMIIATTLGAAAVRLMGETLQEFGLILGLVLLAVGGLVILRRRRRTHAMTKAEGNAAPVPSPCSRLFQPSPRAARNWSSHEYWPLWLIYLPVIPAMIHKALKHRTLRAPFALNRGLPLGGLVGESKAHIIHRLQHPAALAIYPLLPERPERRLHKLQDYMGYKKWTWPLILKPNAGERGAGVQVIHSAEEALTYFALHTEPLIAQEFANLPAEVGIFILRPRKNGPLHIFSITRKELPQVVGDGTQSLSALIAANPRLMKQRHLFQEFLRQDGHRIIPSGEVYRLGEYGNHARGACFRDGAHLITPALTQEVTRWFAAWPEFRFGRMDVRAASFEHIARGEACRLIEVNGLSSESTNIYDPDRDGWFLWKTITKQWNAAFDIGRDALRCQPNHTVPSVFEVLRRVLNELRHNKSMPAP